MSDMSHGSDEIPALTVTSLTNQQIKKTYIKKYAAKRVMRLFICQLLDKDLIKNHEQLEKHFLFGTCAFRNVVIVGTIVGVQFLKFKTKDRTLISVDDGTGVMDCYAEYNSILDATQNELEEQLQDTTELYKAIPTNELAKAAMMMLQSSKEKLKNFLDYKSLHLGQSVQIIGSLSQYNGKRSCFVTSITRADSTNNIDHLESVENLLYNVYFKTNTP